jgi:predicted DNA-binding helix-hairpin-helix protein
VQLATRVSVNLEAPNAERLAHIAPRKDFIANLLQPMHWAKGLIEASGRRLVSAGQTTQFVVGAAGESDREILMTTAQLYREIGLARAYFSAFQPVADTPLENHPPTPPLREHRLYQSDWLLRLYDFTFEDLVFDGAGNLPREADPKMMWAQVHPECFPIEINQASREELLRVPGLGPRSVARILRLRRQGTFGTLTDLKKTGAVTSRAAPFILLNGRRPPHQMSLW